VHDVHGWLPLPGQLGPRRVRRRHVVIDQRDGVHELRGRNVQHSNGRELIVDMHCVQHRHVLDYDRCVVVSDLHQLSYRDVLEYDGRDCVHGMCAVRLCIWDWQHGLSPLRGWHDQQRNGQLIVRSMPDRHGRRWLG